MGEVNTRCLRAVDLRAQFRLYLCWLRVLGDDVRFKRKVTVRRKQAGHLVGRTHRAPSQRGPLAVQGLMNSKIGCGMILRPTHDFRKPRAWHENAGGSDPV